MRSFFDTKSVWRTVALPAMVLVVGGATIPNPSVAVAATISGSVTCTSFSMTSQTLSPAVQAGDIVSIAWSGCVQLRVSADLSVTSGVRAYQFPNYYLDEGASGIVTFNVVSTPAAGSQLFVLGGDIAFDYVEVLQGSTALPPRTLGYWKSASLTTLDTSPIALGSYTVDTQQKARGVLNATNCGTRSGDGVGCLAGQLLVAKLNVGDGVTDTCISTTIVDADIFLIARAYSGPLATYSLTKAQRSASMRLASALANFNTNGC